MLPGGRLPGKALALCDFRVATFSGVLPSLRARRRSAPACGGGGRGTAGVGQGLWRAAGAAGSHNAGRHAGCARASMSSLRQPADPFCAAMYAGVAPLSLALFTSAPESMRNFSTSGRFSIAAM